MRVRSARPPEAGARGWNKLMVSSSFDGPPGISERVMHTSWVTKSCAQDFLISSRSASLLLQESFFLDLINDQLCIFPAE